MKINCYLQLNSNINQKATPDYIKVKNQWLGHNKYVKNNHLEDTAQ